MVFDELWFTDSCKPVVIPEQVDGKVGGSLRRPARKILSQILQRKPHLQHLKPQLQKQTQQTKVSCVYASASVFMLVFLFTVCNCHIVDFEPRRRRYHTRAADRRNRNRYVHTITDFYRKHIALHFVIILSSTGGQNSSNTEQENEVVGSSFILLFLFSKSNPLASLFIIYSAV